MTMFRKKLLSSSDKVEEGFVSTIIKLEVNETTCENETRISMFFRNNYTILVFLATAVLKFILYNC